MKTAVITLVGALLLASAPTAWADEEADFISALHGAGFVFDGGGRAASVELGRWVCDGLDSGHSPMSMAYGIQESSTRLSGTAGPEVFVNLTVRYLCPRHLYALP